MYEREGLLKENNKHAAGDAILIEPVFMHVGFLGENKLGMLEAYHRSFSQSRGTNISCGQANRIVLIGRKIFSFLSVQYGPIAASCNSKKCTYLIRADTGK